MEKLLSGVSRIYNAIVLKVQYLGWKGFDWTSIVLLGAPSDERSSMRSSSVVKICLLPLAVHCLSTGICQATPSTVLILRRYSRTSAVISAALILHSLLYFSRRNQQGRVLAELTSGLTLAICLLDLGEANLAWRSTGSTLGLLLFLSHRTRKEPIRSSLGLGLGILGMDTLLMGLIMKFGPRLLDLPSSYSSQVLYTGLLLLISGLLLDDLQSILGPCVDGSDCLARERLPSFPLLVQLSCAIFGLFYAHLGLRRAILLASRQLSSNQTDIELLKGNK